MPVFYTLRSRSGASCLRDTIVIAALLSLFQLACLASQHGLASSDQDRALFAAIGKGRLKDVLAAISRGADANSADPKSNLSPLLTVLEPLSSGRRYRVPKADPAIVALLLEHGASVDAKDPEGRTSLMLVVGYHDEKDADKVAQLLLDHGADVNATDKRGCTVLNHYVRWFTSTTTLRQIMARGGNVNMPGDEKRTPLMHASLYGSPDIVKLLIDSGARINDRDEEGRTALRLIEKGTYMHMTDHWPFKNETVMILKASGGAE